MLPGLQLHSGQSPNPLTFSAAPEINPTKYLRHPPGLLSNARERSAILWDYQLNPKDPHSPSRVFSKVFSSRYLPISIPSNFSNDKRGLLPCDNKNNKLYQHQQLLHLLSTMLRHFTLKALSQLIFTRSTTY